MKRLLWVIGFSAFLFQSSVVWADSILSLKNMNFLVSLGGLPANFGSPSENFGSPSENFGSPSENFGSPSENFGTPSENFGSL